MYYDVMKPSSLIVKLMSLGSAVEALCAVSIWPYLRNLLGGISVTLVSQSGDKLIALLLCL